MPRDNDALEIGEARAIRQQRDDAIEHFKRTDRERCFADIATEPRLVCPARQIRCQIMPRGVRIGKDLRRDNQRVRLRVARFRGAQGQIKIFISIAQTSVHDDHCALDLRLQLADVAAEIRGNHCLAKRGFYLQAFRRDRLDRAAIRRILIHGDRLTEPRSRDQRQHRLQHVRSPWAHCSPY